MVETKQFFSHCFPFFFVSAVGADPNSPVFYNKVKGELERDLEKIGFKTLHIIRPSLLLGNREEFRLGEEIEKLMVKPFLFLIPGKYKPVHAGVIAQKSGRCWMAPHRGFMCMRAGRSGESQNRVKPWAHGLNK